MEELSQVINTFDIKEDAKKFLNTRTNSTFQSQFIFYFNLSSDFDRAIIRAIEETLAIEREEYYYLRNDLLSVINNNEIDNEEKLNQLKNKLG